VISSANRISAPRPPPRRPVSPSRDDYTSPYYTKENNYRPPQPPVAQSYRDTYSIPRENNYRPQYDDRNPWSQPYSRGTSQLPSTAFRRDLGQTRNVSRDTGDRYSYRSYSPSPERPLRGRHPRRPNHDSRSRSVSKSSRHPSSPKATSVISKGNYVAPRRRRSRSQTPSRSRSQSRTRSLSSSDVASTRASQRSSREPQKAPQQQPQQQPPQHNLSAKPRENINLLSTRPIAPLPVTKPVVQPKPLEKKDAPVVSLDKQRPISQPTAPKQEERIISVPKQTDNIPVPISKGASL
jgi:hypothetical protein